MSSVPLIDVAAARTGDRADRTRVARQIDDACRDIGFFTITGHGVPPAVVQELREAAHAFFALPVAAKQQASHPVEGTPRGYHAGLKTTSAPAGHP